MDLPTVTQMAHTDPKRVLFRADHGAAQHLGAYRQAVVYERDLFGFTCGAELWPKLCADLTRKNVVIVELPPRIGTWQPPAYRPEPRHRDQSGINARGMALVRSALAAAKADRIVPADDPWSW